MMSSPDEPDQNPGSDDGLTPREKRLQEIKAAIENGTYDTDEKLEQALSRMFDSVTDDDDKPRSKKRKP